MEKHTTQPLLNQEIAGYCRISVDEELDRDNTSIENQKKIIEEFVKAKFPKCKLTIYEDRDRSGYTFEQLLEGSEAQKQLLREIDILIDGPFVMAEKSLEIAFRGSRNQRILDVPKSLAAGKAVPTTAGRWLGEY